MNFCNSVLTTVSSTDSSNISYYIAYNSLIDFHYIHLKHKFLFKASEVLYDLFPACSYDIIFHFSPQFSHLNHISLISVPHTFQVQSVSKSLHFLFLLLWTILPKPSYVWLPLIIQMSPPQRGLFWLLQPKYPITVSHISLFCLLYNIY